MNRIARYVPVNTMGVSHHNTITYFKMFVVSVFCLFYLYVRLLKFIRKTMYKNCRKMYVRYIMYLLDKNCSLISPLHTEDF